MDLRPLGRSDIRIAPLVLGGNVFGWNVDETTSFAILDAFVDAGFNAIDTADSYSRWVPGHKGGEFGDGDRQLAEDEAASATKVVIATKVGNDMGEGKNLEKDYMLRAAEACLQRLQVDCIDLLQTHFDDEVTPVEETLAAYAQLIAQGKVRAIGASNMSAGAAEGVARRQQDGSASRATRACSRTIISTTASISRASMRRSARPRGSASSPIILSPPASSPANTARRRRPRKAGARRQGEGIFRCAWAGDSRGARCGGAAPWRDAGANVARLADGASDW